MADTYAPVKDLASFQGIPEVERLAKELFGLGEKGGHDLALIFPVYVARRPLAEGKTVLVKGEVCFVTAHVLDHLLRPRFVPPIALRNGLHEAGADQVGLLCLESGRLAQII